LGEAIVAVETWMGGVDQLQSRVRGRVLTTGVDGYDQSRSVFYAMIDRYPALVLRCEHREDVIHGVAFARDHGLNVAVKGGGHSVAGSAVCDGGVMLDMSAMTKIVIDASQRIAVAEPGVLLSQLDAATAEHGLVTPLGVVSVTGIAGLTLGGGLGWLNGHHGLACDTRRRGHRDCGRPAAHGNRRAERRPLLGGSRRRRKFRRRRLVHLPTAPLFRSNANIGSVVS
jgi:hypothetical protein